MSARPHLHVVDASTGVVLPDGCPECGAKDDIIAAKERDLRGWAIRYAQLKREKDEEARAHPSWPKLSALYDLWRRECSHMRSAFTPDDFWLALPFFEKHGPELCERAIAGLKFDPWITRRKNGRPHRHDDWARDIFKDRPHFEEACNRAPRGWSPTTQPSKMSSTKIGEAASYRPSPGTEGS